MNRSSQTGAALVESIIIICGLIGLLALFPQLAKLQSIRQSAVEASRYANWQLTVGEQASRESVANRLFIAPNAALQSDITASAFRASNPSTNPRARSHAFKPLAENSHNELPSLGRTSIELSTLTIRTDNNAEKPGKLIESGVKTIRKVSDWLGDSDAIAGGRGIVKHTVAFATHGQESENQIAGDCSKDSVFCFTAHSALLIDGWEAADNKETEDAAAVLVPTTLLKPLGDTLAKVSAVPLLKEFSKMGAGFGCINTTVLPTKELSGGITTIESEIGERDVAC